MDFDVEGDPSKIDLVEVILETVHEINDHSRVEGEIVADREAVGWEIVG